MTDNAGLYNIFFSHFPKKSLMYCDLKKKKAITSILAARSAHVMQFSVSREVWILRKRKQKSVDDFWKLSIPSSATSSFFLSLCAFWSEGEDGDGVRVPILRTQGDSENKGPSWGWQNREKEVTWDNQWHCAVAALDMKFFEKQWLLTW